MDISQLQQIYADYDRTLSAANKKVSIFTGLLGQRSVDDPRNHPCNKEFLEKCEAWVKTFAQSNPGPSETEEVCRWILEAAERNARRPVYWHYLIAQGFVRDLTNFLDPESRRELANWYNSTYPKRTRLPIQEEIYGFLSK